MKNSVVFCCRLVSQTNETSDNTVAGNNSS